MKRSEKSYMNLHFREKSASLLKLEIIIQRLYKKDPRIPEIKVDFEREMKGFIGEQKVDYFTDLL